MKTVKYIILGLLSLALFACTEDAPVREESPAVEGSGVFFKADNTKSYSFSEAGIETVTLNLQRSNTDQSVTANLTSNAPAGITVPSSVAFAANAQTASFNVTIDQAKLEAGSTQTVKIAISNDTTPYGADNWTLSFKIFKELNWSEVTSTCIVEENLLTAAFGMDPHVFECYVEKLENHNVYRIANIMTKYTDKNGKVYQNSYYREDGSDGIWPDEVVDPDATIWTVVDADGYWLETSGGVAGATTNKSLFPTNSVWIPRQTANFAWSYGEFQYCQAAYNLSSGGKMIQAGNEDFPMGVYTSASKSYTFGAMMLYLPTNGWYGPCSAETVLYLDQNLMGVSFERDFTYDEAGWNGAGIFTSQATKLEWEQPVMPCVFKDTSEDGQKLYETFVSTYGKPFCLPSLYAEGYDIFFCVKDNAIVIPDEYKYQDLGMSTFDHEVYAKINVNKSTVSLSDNRLDAELYMEFVAMTEEGEVEFNINNYTESFTTYMPWQPMGTAQVSESILGQGFGLGHSVYNVEIQENVAEVGKYRLVDAYGANYPFNEAGDYSTTTHYLEINAVDPAKAYIPMTACGVNWGYGELNIASACNEAGFEGIETPVYGTRTDDGIIFPYHSIYLYMEGVAARWVQWNAAESCGMTILFPGHYTTEGAPVRFSSNAARKEYKSYNAVYEYNEPSFVKNTDRKSKNTNASKKVSGQPNYVLAL